MRFLTVVLLLVLSLGAQAAPITIDFRYNSDFSRNYTYVGQTEFEDLGTVAYQTEKWRRVVRYESKGFRIDIEMLMNVGGTNGGSAFPEWGVTHGDPVFPSDPTSPPDGTLVYPDPGVLFAFSSEPGVGNLSDGYVTPPCEECGISMTITSLSGSPFAMYGADYIANSGGIAVANPFSGLLSGGGAADLSAAMGTGDWLSLSSVTFGTLGTGGPYGDLIDITNIVLEEGATSVVPVPAAVWLFGSALVGLVGWRRRQST